MPTKMEFKYGVDPAHQKTVSVIIQRDLEDDLAAPPPSSTDISTLLFQYLGGGYNMPDSMQSWGMQFAMAMSLTQGEGCRQYAVNYYLTQEDHYDPDYFLFVGSASPYTNTQGVEYQLGAPNEVCGYQGLVVGSRSRRPFAWGYMTDYVLTIPVGTVFNNGSGGTTPTERAQQGLTFIRKALQEETLLAVSGRELESTFVGCVCPSGVYKGPRRA